MKQNSKQLFLMVFSVFCLGITAGFSATTGKIAGKVIDQTTGEPLPGANILIVGTNFGAAADAEGNYFIINLPPGRYNVQARMMGYGTVETQNIYIRTNATTTVDFKLN
ncbi:MAG: carboxypeptidase-like regulatory domain-containing protein, partial [Calditrichaeota bacterium]